MLVLEEADALPFTVIQYSTAQWCSIAPAAEYVITNMLYMCTLSLKDIPRDVDLLISYEISPVLYSLKGKNPRKYSQCFLAKLLTDLFWYHIGRKIEA